MGMAASQARYIALSARKSNIEYEGQQINQSRLALANQSANLFNQMMDMSVPTPPSTTDFTKVQYSYSDGVNTEVLSNYYQLGVEDSDYNYVVTTFHTEKVFTGSKKKMNDPQVRATVEHNYTYDPTSFDSNKEMVVKKAVENADKTYTFETSDGATKIFRPVAAADLDQVRALNAGLGNTTNDKVEDVKVDIGKYGETADDRKNTLTAVSVDDLKPDVAEEATELEGLKAMFGESISGKTYYKNAEGVYFTAAQLEETDPSALALTVGKKVSEQGAGLVEGEGAEQLFYTDGTTYITKADLDTAVQKYNTYVETGYEEKNNVTYMTLNDAPENFNYTHVGNSVLTELTLDAVNQEDVQATIDQILKDMKGANGDPIASENLMKCFETQADGSLKYIGGLYTFKQNGQTCYTTKADLDHSLNTSIVDNGIDVQQNKLAYYTATYQDTKVETTQKALLQTDGEGRFNSLKLEDDSIVYTLNTETVTDEDAYNDAMNQYYYENAIYEQKIQEINAKTEVIHAQDRTLEIRMEQLATEQSALQNEMEAVKKVVDKHLEQGFKTFGG